MRDSEPGYNLSYRSSGKESKLERYIFASSVREVVERDEILRRWRHGVGNGAEWPDHLNKVITHQSWILYLPLRAGQ